MLTHPTVPSIRRHGEGVSRPERCRRRHTPLRARTVWFRMSPMTTSGSTSAPLDVPAHLFLCIDHAGVAVPDLDAAIELYTTAFGMTLVHEETYEEQGVREAMMSVGGDADPTGACIQLLAPLNEQSTIAKFLDRSGPGLQQLAYRVRDLDAVSA